MKKYPIVILVFLVVMISGCATFQKAGQMIKEDPVKITLNQLNKTWIGLAEWVAEIETANLTSAELDMVLKMLDGDMPPYIENLPPHILIAYKNLSKFNEEDMIFGDLYDIARALYDTNSDPMALQAALNRLELYILQKIREHNYKKEAE